MPDLRAQLRKCLSGRICWMGVGNVDHGDDGFGVRLAEDLVAVGVPDVVIAGTTPDRWIGQLASFDHVVFLDAVEFGGESGSVVFLDSSEMAARFPQISTHKISLGMLARWIEAGGTTKAWLLGVQPESVKSSDQLSAMMQTTRDVLYELLRGVSSPAGSGIASPGGPALSDNSGVRAC